MMTIKKHTLLTCVILLLLTGCVEVLTGPKFDTTPLAKDFGSMPLDAATITSAVAVQAATPPLQKVGHVTFSDAASTALAIQLGAENFGFTGSKLFVHHPATNTSPGLAAAEIEYTDAFDRKATVLYRAEFTRDGDRYHISKLNIAKTYKAKPRVKVTIVPNKELPSEQFTSYENLITFLANKGLSAEKLANAGNQEYAIVAVGKDWSSSTSKMTVAVSANKMGSDGYKRSSCSYSVNGWPVAVATGTFNPADTKNKLYAKVSINDGKSIMSITQLLGTYQLAAFDK